MTMKLVMTVLLAGTVMAQGTPQEGLAALKESLAQNQATLRTYSWVETTQVLLKGEVKKQEQKQCYYGADGKVQKTAIAAQPAQQQQDSGGRDRDRRGNGRMKERIVENKVEEIGDYMEKVVALVHQYVPPDAQKIQAAASAGNLATAPSGATLAINVKSYNKPGDLLSIDLDTAAKQLASYRVQTFVEKPKEDDVKLDVTFAKLPDGTAYPANIVLDVAAKEIQVKVTNSGYKKAGS